MNKKTTLKDLYSFPGFRALARLKDCVDHPGARIVTLKRRQKKRFVRVGKFTAVGTTAGLKSFATWILAIRPSTWNSRFAGFNVAGVRP
jgi:hypothetical protein